jgi:hypothetical protein
MPFALNPPVTRPALDTLLTNICRNAAAPVRVAQPFTLECPWHPAQPCQSLTAVVERRSDGVRAFVTDALVDTTEGDFEQLADRCAAAIVDPSAPLRLASVTVAKPWGREHWYTGVEARAVAGVTDGRHVSPIPWVLALAPGAIQGTSPLMLLKILDPNPDPVRGDLYFELHERKREIYVVTHIDPDAWPDGVGAIRLGMNPMLRAQYGDDDRFRQDYLAAVTSYEQVRRAIDDATGADAALHMRESELRNAMDAFTALRPVKVGDVITVPPQFPHALQHGVRVVEFQTPDYERLIISFGQQVLTQPHWDTSRAVRAMSLDPPGDPAVEVEQDHGSGVRIECLTRLPEFAVQRINLAPGASVRLPRTTPHAVLIVIAGSVHLQNLELHADAGCLLPGTLQPETLANPTSTPAVALLAGPGL